MILFKTGSANKHSSTKLVDSESPFGLQRSLTFFPWYTKQNDGYYVLFASIYINTRYAYAYGAKTKDADTILYIMEIFHEQEMEIDTITTDEGTKFTHDFFIKYCEDNNIKTFS